MPCTLPASLADAAVCRGSFHAVLGGEAGDAVFADFSAALQKAQAEGRRTNVNIRHQPGAHSPELDAWIAADPESHFARFTPEQKAHPDSGHNFVFLPRIAGTED